MGMNISDFFDMDVLIQILTDWSTATGIGIIAVDEKGEYMMDPIGCPVTLFCSPHMMKCK